MIETLLKRFPQLQELMNELSPAAQALFKAALIESNQALSETAEESRQRFIVSANREYALEAQDEGRSIAAANAVNKYAALLFDEVDLITDGAVKKYLILLDRAGELMLTIYGRYEGQYLVQQVRCRWEEKAWRKRSEFLKLPKPMKLAPGSEQQTRSDRRNRARRKDIGTQQIREKVRQLRAEELDFQTICSRLGDSARPPRASWRHLTWPNAYRQHRAVIKWLSEACRDLPSVTN